MPSDIFVASPTAMVRTIVPANFESLKTRKVILNRPFQAIGWIATVRLLGKPSSETEVLAAYGLLCGL